MLRNPNYVYGSDDLYLPAKLNFGDFILNTFWRYKDTVALINGSTNEILTYGEIAQEAMNLAVSLSRAGVQRGDVVAICSENRREYWSTVVGIACLGATVTTINIAYSKDELKHVTDISKPRCFFCSPQTYKDHVKTMKSLSYVKLIILYSDQRYFGTMLYKELAKADVGGMEKNIKFEEFEVADVQGQTDTLFILYSSGTTGLPKGVMLTHVNVLTACLLASALDPNATALTITPWYHTMGLTGTLRNLVGGGTNVYLPKFEAELYLATIEKYKITQLIIVPPVAVALSKYQSHHDITSVKLVYSGGAPLHGDTAKAIQIRFPNIQSVLQGYGLTEATLGVIRDRYDIAHLAKPGGTGYIVDSTVVKVVDLETGKPLGPNQSGEICIKGASVMKGYKGKDMKEDFDDEGFFKTGDIGYYDDDKCFFIVDRLKELIKYKAYQVPPAEIEAVLLQHSGVRDVGVVGISHPLAGEVPLAFVVLQPGTTISEGELQKFVAERLSNPKHLRGGVRFVREIPKNPSGKILRRHLRRMADAKISKL